MAQSVKHLTLDLGSGHDLMVCGIKPHVGLCTDGSEPVAILSLPLSLFAPSWLPLSLSLSLSLSLKINK